MRVKIRLFIILLIIALFAAAGYYYFIENKENNQIKETENNNGNDSEETSTCTKGYKCETIDGIEYKWTEKTSLNLKNVYNYDTGELEAGVLKINNGKLEFLDLTNKVLRSFSEVEGNVIAIEASIDLCDEQPIYIALTDTGKLYISDAHNGLLVSEAFSEMDSEYSIKEFMTKINSTDYTCTITEIYAKTSEGKVIKLVSNENITE